MQFFDAHTHPQFPAYDADRDEMISRAKTAGVKMVAVGTQFSTSEAAIQLAEQHPEYVWATVGFHPNHLSADWHHDKNEQALAKPEEFDIEALRTLAKNKKVVAIGECGLDYFRSGEETKGKQAEVLLAQVELAKELDKPLMIHCRNAFDDLIELLKPHAKDLRPGIIHFFTGTKENASKLLELGFSFTFGGVVTFARDYDEAIRAIPLDRILSETDAPYVAPAPYRGKRNEPSYVVEVVKKLAELKGVSESEMARETMGNAERILTFRG